MWAPDLRPPRFDKFRSQPFGLWGIRLVASKNATPDLDRDPNPGEDRDRDLAWVFVRPLGPKKPQQILIPSLPSVQNTIRICGMYM